MRTVRSHLDRIPNCSEVWVNEGVGSTGVLSIWNFWGSREGWGGVIGWEGIIRVGLSMSCAICCVLQSLWQVWCCQNNVPKSFLKLGYLWPTDDRSHTSLRG